MNPPRVYLLSYWKNDVGRQIEARMAHLLGKSYPNLGWLWVVGDSTDATYMRLAEQARDGSRCVIVLDIGGTDPTKTRYQRLSETATRGYALIPADADYVLVHESDLRSPVDVVERLVAHAEAGRCPVAGWPMLEAPGLGRVFYDIWAYRKNGEHFTNHPPYHACYNAKTPFEVDSAGCVVLFAADDLRDRIVRQRCLVEVCEHLRALGRRIWVDPTLIIEQPASLWVPQVPHD